MRVKTAKALYEGLVDFHCHLDLYPDYMSQIRECEELGIKTLSMTNAPSVWCKNKELVQNCEHVRVALGLHPQLANERKNELSLFEKYIHETRYVGEVGLDKDTKKECISKTQSYVFTEILKLCATSGGKILSLHSRNSSAEVIELVNKFLPHNKGKVVFHWFNGSLSEAKKAVELGAFFSVNTQMIKSKQSRKILEQIPPQNILTETDGPFIKFGAHPITPKEVSNVISELSHIWSMNDNSAKKLVQNNLRELLIV